MKKTALTDVHIALGAKMVPFAGFNMPVQYTGINDEHETVRTAVGMFDVSHMGEFILKGEKALDLIQKVSSNDASKLYDGKVQYGYLPNENGGIVDDFLTYKIDDKTYLLVVNASNIDKDWDHISKYNTFGAKMTNASDDMSLLAVQGPKATEILQKLTETNLSEIPYYNFTVGSVAGVNDVIISNTGYTGSGGFEIYFKNDAAEKLWDAIIEAGAEEGIIPCGLAARDTLRLEKGFCLYGNDIDDTTSPIEAGLGWITKFDKDFVSKETFAKQKEEGVTRKLVGFELTDKGVPRHDYPVVDAEGNVIGKVTSGTQSPMKKVGLGLAYVDKPLFRLGSEIFIQVRNKNIPAKVVKMPFV